MCEHETATWLGTSKDGDCYYQLACNKCGQSLMESYDPSLCGQTVYISSDTRRVIESIREPK